MKKKETQKKNDICTKNRMIKIKKQNIYQRPAYQR